MAEDGEVLRQLWDSYLPVSFHLSANDLQSMKDPEPYYSMVPRLSYFSLIIDKVVVYFSQFIDLNTKSAANLWLDFLGVPLKLNYPIGLLYDLNVADIELPWSITVNFDNFPSDQIVRCNSRASMESTYMYALKEADVLKHHTPRVNTMQKRDHTALWKGLLDYKFDAFWTINRRLMTPDLPSTSSDPSNPASTKPPTAAHFRHVPFRLYLVKQGEFGPPLYVQKLVSPMLKTEDGVVAETEATFGHLLAEMLKVSIEELAAKYRFLVHGIEPPLDTPLQWMSEHFSYLDNFLHVAVFEKT